LTSAFCQLCGRAVEGQGKSFHHPKWGRDLSMLVCLDCTQNKPLCQICDLPMAAESPNGVCLTCSQHNQYCRSCGRPIKHKFVEFGGLGLYCETCFHERRPCDVCGAPLTEAHWRLSDGRITCAHCHATAIYSPDEAAHLYEDIKTAVVQLYGLQLNVPTGLALVDRNQLGQVIHQQQEKMRNTKTGAVEIDPLQTLGLYARQGMRRGLYVQSGLPRMLFLQVAAHEYAHAWQGENCPLLSDQLVHEGFAEWLAYRIMGRYGYSHCQERMEARKDIYGMGLRWALDIESKQGSAGLIKACQQVE